MTLEEFITNPAGKGSTVIPNMQGVKDQYYNKLTHMEPKIKINWYQLRKGKHVIAHIKIPSETTTNLVYDVVYEFDTSKIDHTTPINLKRIPFRMFSNCPSFTFTYTKVFNSKDLLINWLNRRCIKDALRKDPAVRNPYNIISFEKSSYLSALYLDKFDLSEYGIKLIHIKKINSTRDVYNLIKSQEEIIALHSKYKKVDDREKERQKIKEKVQRHQAYNDSRKLSGENKHTIKTTQTSGMRKTITSSHTKKPKKTKR